jgi:hypothetical protein
MKKNLKTLLLILAYSFTTLSYALPAPKYLCSTKEAAAIETAVKNYLDKNTGLHSVDFTVLTKQCVGAYAKTKIHPLKPITDDATIYLRKNKDQWQVLSLGTDFDATFLKQIPKPLRY